MFAVSCGSTLRLLFTVAWQRLSCQVRPKKASGICVHISQKCYKIMILFCVCKISMNRVKLLGTQ